MGLTRGTRCNEIRLLGSAMSGEGRRRSGYRRKIPSEDLGRSPSRNRMFEYSRPSGARFSQLFLQNLINIILRLEVYRIRHELNFNLNYFNNK